MPSPPDNRRLTSRILAFEVLNLLGEMADRYGCDVIELLVFTGIWTANTAHLRGTTTRYATLRDVPPDSQRKPVDEQTLSERLRLPRAIQDTYVEGLIQRGQVERRDSGLLVPSAVFTRADMLAGTNDSYSRLIEMLARMRAAGVQLGEA